MFASTVSAGASETLARLHADVDEVNALPLDSYTDDEVLELWRDLERVRRRLAGIDHKLINQAESRQLHTSFGLRSVTVLARDVLHLEIGEARARVRAAEALGPRRGLTGEPLAPIFARTAEAIAAGEIGIAAAAVIVRTVEQLPDAVRATEDLAIEASLVEHARNLDVDQLKLVARRLSAMVDPDGILKDEKYRDRHREFHIHPRPDGSARFEGEATVELAEWLRTVVDTFGAPRPEANGTKDPRTPAQRRHDALLEALKLLARARQLPNCAGVTTTVLLILTDYTLATGEGTATTGHGAIVSGRRAQHLIGGDARVVPVRLTTTKALAEWGHTRRLFTEGQRLALIARDRGCSFPGCDAPPQYTEAHHVTRYTDGGPTCASNGTLLCGYHHDHFAELGWECAMLDGRPHWIPPIWYADRTPMLNTAHDPLG